MTDFDDVALEIRRKILDMSRQAKQAHLGGAMSLVEIMVALYCGGVLHFDPGNPEDPERDRVFLSKGHGAMAWYAVLNVVGVISDDELAGYHMPGHPLQVHPSRNLKQGIEHTGGSLGQGFPLAAGVALALRLKQNPAKVYVILGDGELNEGSNWEAASFASAKGLSNIVCIIDANGLQLDGPSSDVLNFEPLKEKWLAFGFDVSECDGHNIGELIGTLKEPHVRPKAIIARTTKGKGLSFAENVPAWHFNDLTERLYEQGRRELGEE